jgi:pimeloyl-ACP methyl ester carboxylesterase
MEKPLPLNGITVREIATPRLKQNVYFSGSETGFPVIFLHGNFSAALYWEEVMLALPKGYRAIAPDMRGYGWTEDKLIDATRGYRDWSDDLDALLVTLGIARAHFVGWSLGGGVLYRFSIDHPDKVRSLSLVNPVSPFGFGGTKDLDGKPCFPDFAGSGGGLVNPEFVRRIIAGDRSSEDPNSPLSVINTFYYKPPFRAAREQDFLTASLAEKMGPERYPGDFTPSANWPNVGPGVWGPINAGAPGYIQADVPAFIALDPKPPVLWIRGSHDQIVSDNSMFDIGALGKLGFIPGWPGEEIYPPQPMVSQSRCVLDQYVARGGHYEEHVILDTAHGPNIENPQAFNVLLHAFLARW